MNWYNCSEGNLSFSKCWKVCILLTCTSTSRRIYFKEIYHGRAQNFYKDAYYSITCHIYRKAKDTYWNHYMVRLWVTLIFFIFFMFSVSSLCTETFSITKNTLFWKYMLVFNKCIELFPFSPPLFNTTLLLFLNRSPEKIGISTLEVSYAFWKLRFYKSCTLFIHFSLT